MKRCFVAYSRRSQWVGERMAAAINSRGSAERNHIRKPHLYSPVALAVLAGLSGMLLMDTAKAQKPKPIPAGDCQSMVAATGSKGIWYGEYSGRAQDETSEYVYPFSGRGCFTGEYACRRWTHEMLTAAGGWPAVRSCRPYNEVR